MADATLSELFDKFLTEAGLTDAEKASMRGQLSANTPTFERAFFTSGSDLPTGQEEEILVVRAAMKLFSIHLEIELAATESQTCIVRIRNGLNYVDITIPADQRYVAHTVDTEGDMFSHSPGDILKVEVMDAGGPTEIASGLFSDAAEGLLTVCLNAAYD